jgi:hypothetical protein
LLELVDSHGNKDIWAKKPVDRTLRITPFLCREFDLQKNGLRQKTGKKAARRKRKR